MSDEAKLGTIPKGDEGRDAVHVAIVPVQARENIPIGGWVKLTAGGKAISSDFGSAVGIADPFREQPAIKGSWFWLCLFPKTIKGLRHVWEHPAFSPEASPLAVPSDDTSDSEAWLKDYVREHCPYWNDEADGGYSEFLNYVTRERWIFYNGSDCHGLSDVEHADELFRHLSVVLGRRIDASYFESFTCTC